MSEYTFLVIRLFVDVFVFFGDVRFREVRIVRFWYSVLLGFV